MLVKNSIDEQCSDDRQKERQSKISLKIDKIDNSYKNIAIFICLKSSHKEVSHDAYKKRQENIDRYQHRVKGYKYNEQCP